MKRSRIVVIAAIVGVCTGAAPHAQPQQALAAELRRIFEANEYASRPFGPVVWFDRNTYGLADRTGSGDERVLVSVDAASGTREVLADRSLLTPAGASTPLDVEGYSWSPDRKRALVFTNTRRVWRRNTRGDY